MINIVHFTAQKIDTFIQTLKIKLPKMAIPSNHFIACNNGLIDRITGNLMSHSTNHWATVINPHDYSLVMKPTPNFDKSKEVVIKITSSGKTVKSIKNHIDYISRIW